MHTPDDMRSAIGHALGLLTNAINKGTTTDFDAVYAMGVATGVLHTITGYLDATGAPGGTYDKTPPANDEWAWDTLGATVKARREWLGLSQTSLAANGGPSEQTIGRIEGNRRCKYSSDTYTKLEKGLRWAPGTALAILTRTYQGDRNQQLIAAGLPMENTGKDTASP